jgi:dihydrofolate synthase/folylpolyglutamate synthase
MRVGLFTSPHLERYNERIEIDGAPVSDADFARALEAALSAAHIVRPDEAIGTPAGFTEFELLTAAALWLFRERGVDIAVLEVGLGGRWDATSVAAASVAVITGVGLDHTAILGDTLEAIAAEKAAIIRPASAPVLGPGTDGLDAIFLRAAEAVSTHARAVREDLEFSPVAEELTVRFRILERPSSPDGLTRVSVDGVHAHYPELALAGPAYQAANIATAVAAAEAALGRELHVERASAALRSLTLPGRFELAHTDPLVIVDGSHNPQAAEILAHAIRDAFPDPHERPIVLLGILADKDARGIVAALAEVASSIAVTRSDSPRALSPSALAEMVTDVAGSPPLAVFDSVSDALTALMPASRVGIIVTGSITTAGEARAALRNT